MLEMKGKMRFIPRILVGTERCEGELFSELFVN